MTYTKDGRTGFFNEIRMMMLFLYHVVWQLIKPSETIVPRYKAIMCSNKKLYRFDRYLQIHALKLTRRALMGTVAILCAVLLFSPGVNSSEETIKQLANASAEVTAVRVENDELKQAASSNEEEVNASNKRFNDLLSVSERQSVEYTEALTALAEATERLEALTAANNKLREENRAKELALSVKATEVAELKAVNLKLNIVKPVQVTKPRPTYDNTDIFDEIEELL